MKFEEMGRQSVPDTLLEDMRQWDILQKKLQKELNTYSLADLQRALNYLKDTLPPSPK